MPNHKNHITNCFYYRNLKKISLYLKKDERNVTKTTHAKVTMLPIRHMQAQQDWLTYLYMIFFHFFV